MQTIFDKIVNKEIKSWIVWESQTHLAFLTPFPNTPGLTVVIPKNNIGDDFLDLNSDAYHKLLDSAHIVAKLLKKALGVSRVALVIEGTGVAHVHIKLYPLHGNLASKTNVLPHHEEFYKEYIGYITTVEGPLMDESKLTEIQQKILNIQKD